MSKFKELIKKNKKTLILLFIIFFVGIFLRTYNFHDWLRFSRDQVRDVSLISNALEGKEHLPLLGPNAGTTKFRLGPVYYYFSYASEKMFGNYPDKMAYPSVFFSILSIPLLFFFLKKFFNKNISLAMTAIMSVSYFMVINSRFSSNPNLISFFVLLYLYALLEILNNPKGKNIVMWGALVGIGMGVGIQLHTTLLITMPVITFCVFTYIFFKNKSVQLTSAWKGLLAILLFSLILNASQIYSEFDSHGSNTKKFFKGFNESSSSKSNLGKEIFLISSCQIQANTHIISSFQDDINCKDVFRIPNTKTENKFLYYSGMIITILFSLMGYFLLWKRFRKEDDTKKKNFLGLVILFNFISFIILIPIANIIFVGYFINLFFIPLVLLGLMIEESRKRYGKIGIYIAALAVAFLIGSSLVRDGLAADRYAKGLENNFKNSTLGEVESISEYILSHSEKNSEQYLAGQNGLAERFFRPVNYFTSESEVETNLLKPGDEKKVGQGNIFFYLKENIPEEINTSQKIWGHEIISGKKFSGLTVLILRN
jgi:4-amino-4-deoxy-L-arabinose transferase-like glycosyltransferase